MKAVYLRTACFLVTLCLLGTAAVPPSFAQRPPYVFKGWLIGAREDLPDAPFSISVDCDDVPEVVVQSIPEVIEGRYLGIHRWEFDEYRDLGRGVLRDPATCDITIAPQMLYESVEAQAPLGIIISPNHIRFANVPPGTYDGIFTLDRSMDIFNTEHFSIEWYDDPADPEYPGRGQGPGNEGADYINRLRDALEQAWNTYQALGYPMPRPSPGRADNRILVSVQNPIKVCGRTLEESEGFAVMGRLWIKSSTPTDRLATTAAHELFHLIQQQHYLGYDAEGCDPRLLEVLWFAHTRDNWIGESTAM